MLRPIKNPLEGKFVFVRIPRTASTSICNALGRPCDHVPASKVRKELGEDEWFKRYKFTIVRHPYDRFLSMFYFFSDFFSVCDDPNDFLKQTNLKEFTDNFSFAKPQSYYVDEKLDFIGRFELLQASWQVIKEDLGVKEELPRMRKGLFEKEELSEKSKEVIYDFYKQDFKQFGYGSNESTN